MEYFDELRNINNKRYKIAEISKCKILGENTSYYFWLLFLVVYVVLYILTFLTALTYNASIPLSLSQKIVSALFASATLSSLFGVIIVPTIVVSLVQSIRMKLLISKGTLTVGLVTECTPFGQIYKSNQKHKIGYVYLNSRNSVKTKSSKLAIRTKNALEIGKKVLVVYTDKRTEILSDFLLEGNEEFAGMDYEYEQKNLAETFDDYKAASYDVVGDHSKERNDAKIMIGLGTFFFIVFSLILAFAPIEEDSPLLRIILFLFMPVGCGLGLATSGIIGLVQNKRRTKNEQKILVNAKVTNAKVVTSHIYCEKDEVLVCYAFVDSTGSFQICRQSVGWNNTPPEQIFAAYNPDNPKESILVCAREM